MWVGDDAKFGLLHAALQIGPYIIGKDTEGGREGEREGGREGRREGGRAGERERTEERKDDEQHSY